MENEDTNVLYEEGNPESDPMYDMHETSDLDEAVAGAAEKEREKIWTELLY